MSRMLLPSAAVLTALLSVPACAGERQPALTTNRTQSGRVAELRPYLYLWADRLPVALSARITTLDGPVNLQSSMYLWNIERWYLQP